MYAEKIACNDREFETSEFEVLSQNDSGISFDGRVVTISKSSYDHLAIDEYQDILMTYKVLDRNRAEIPRTVLLKAMRTGDGVSVLSLSDNFIFDDANAAYLDLLESPFGP